ncbi:MAG TPA: PatB family C-S lyase [Sedimentisphaerales bacterium]|jgi:cystathionine beta-lyase|nr:PatB family C-S lyase [Sedimentisphaerales bacterium]HNU28912.1 PatB family C-S lyase [Sedimentisphaerales bacterium]
MKISFDFDRVVERRDSDSLKWAKYKGRDVIPMWVADMDFQAPEPVLDALHERVEHGVFGYAIPPEELTQVVVQRMAQKYQWEIEPSWIVWMPGVVSALNVVCRAFADEGDDVLAFSPIYPPFLSAPPGSGRNIKTVPLARQDGLYVMDPDRFEREITPRSRVLLLCNPHNPVGRRFERRELERIAEVCLRHDIVLCSDEIHCDLVLDDGPHTPTATLGREISARTITLMAPSKTFNIPGLSCSFAIIEDAGLRAKFNRAHHGIVPGVNAMGYAACLAAYRDCEPWRLALIDYLRGNEELVHRFVNEQIPGLSMDHVQATYLAWIDTRPLGLPDPEHFFELAGIGVSDGSSFLGEGFVRLNFGCPRATLLAGLERMKHAVANLRLT